MPCLYEPLLENDQTKKDNSCLSENWSMKIISFTMSAQSISDVQPIEIIPLPLLLSVQLAKLKYLLNCKYNTCVSQEPVDKGISLGHLTS
jgi:hypothetical protein